MQGEEEEGGNRILLTILLLLHRPVSHAVTQTLEDNYFMKIQSVIMEIIGIVQLLNQYKHLLIEIEEIQFLLKSNTSIELSA